MFLSLLLSWLLKLPNNQLSSWSSRAFQLFFLFSRGGGCLFTLPTYMVGTHSRLNKFYWITLFYLCILNHGTIFSKFTNNYESNRILLRFGTSVLFSNNYCVLVPLFFFQIIIQPYQSLKIKTKELKECLFFILKAYSTTMGVQDWGTPVRYPLSVQCSLSAGMRDH